MLRTFHLIFLTVMLASCAHLYKETSYVAEVKGNERMQGVCDKESDQNIFVYKSVKGDFTVSMPVYYPYWWAGPIVLPLFPITPERNDPSFIKILITAPVDQLEREELLKTEIQIKNETDPVKLITIIVTKKDKVEEFVLQFDSPKLVDLKSFSLILPESLTGKKAPIFFKMASDVNYVPLLPVVTEKCVTH
ncbi:MAG: hypothetical protein V4598_13795 [Bdellovibrionota bacterium]